MLIAYCKDSSINLQQKEEAQREDIDLDFNQNVGLLFSLLFI